MREKLFFYDIETTGTQYWKHGIHQISGAIVIDGVTKEKFDVKIKPHDGCVIDPKSLEISGVTEQQILGYNNPCDVHKDIKNLLSKYVDPYNKKDKFHLVGYNILSFDNQFFRQFFTNNNDNYFGSWFWSDCIDIMVLASNRLKSERVNLQDFKQSTVAKYLGIHVDDTKLHDAMYDIEICMKIYEKVK